jgi:hypothetical protein
VRGWLFSAWTALVDVLTRGRGESVEVQSGGAAAASGYPPRRLVTYMSHGGGVSTPEWWRSRLSSLCTPAVSIGGLAQTEWPCQDMTIRLMYDYSVSPLAGAPGAAVCCGAAQGSCPREGAQVGPRCPNRKRPHIRDCAQSVAPPRLSTVTSTTLVD